MSRKYEIAESVGKSWEHVDSYESIEKHHPTWAEDPRKRKYDEIDGSREEYVESLTRQRMVSKDFVLSVDGEASVDVPSPVSGYIRRSPRLDRWGTVEIYDRLGEGAELISRVRHMEPIHVQDGQRIEYGQLLGRQGNKAPPGVRVGLHTHIDFNEWQLNHFRDYIRDLDSGAITPEGKIDEYQRRGDRRSRMDSERPADHWFGSAEQQHPSKDLLQTNTAGTERTLQDWNAADLQTPPPHADAQTLFDHLYAAMKTGDDRFFRQALTTVANADINREFRDHAIAAVDAQERQAALEAQLRETQQQLAQQQEMRMSRQGPSLSL